MAHSANGELVLGVLAGAAGVGLLLLWRRRAGEPGPALPSPQLLPARPASEPATVGGEVPRGRQLQVLEKLNELLAGVEDLRAELRALREAVPQLGGRVRRELGAGPARRAGPGRGAGRRRGPARGPGASSSEEADSEGGYITASTDTEEQNFPVHKPLNTHVEELKLDALLQKADNLRMNASGKVESFELLCDYKEKFRDEIEFIWRFVRAYGDMYELSTDTQEKKQYANIGKTLGEKAVTRAPMNGHCHLWYAVLCGYVSDFEGLQNKINCGHCFKEHLDKAITLLPEEPFLYYLNGRYCYAVSKLSWIEKKMAATLFGKIPSSTVQEALQNFLKVEELHPGFSKSNYMFLAKCYIDLKQKDNALKFCNLAVQLPCVTREDKEAHEEVKKLSSTLKR